MSDPCWSKDAFKIAGRSSGTQAFLCPVLALASPLSTPSFCFCFCFGVGGKVYDTWFPEKLGESLCARKTETLLTCDLTSEKSYEKGTHLIAFLLKITAVSWVRLKENIYCAGFFIEKLVASEPKKPCNDRLSARTQRSSTYRTLSSLI